VIPLIEAEPIRQALAKGGRGESAKSLPVLSAEAMSPIEQTEMAKCYKFVVSGIAKMVI